MERSGANDHACTWPDRAECICMPSCLDHHPDGAVPYRLSLMRAVCILIKDCAYAMTSRSIAPGAGYATLSEVSVISFKSHNIVRMTMH